jgi:uncharacterized membrane protein HdeD (DUF308 family)
LQGYFHTNDKVPAGTREQAMTSSSGILGNMGANAQALCRRTWWVFLVGGLASVIFGVLAFMQPGIALLVLSIFFAAAILVDGASNIVGAVQHREKDGWWIMLLIGILGVVAGGYALLNPPVSMMAFIFLVAFEAILLGVFLLMLGYKVRKATSREWILYVTGALSLLFGILVIMNPTAGSRSIVYLIAGWALVIGALKVLFAFKVKNLPERAGEKFSALR